MRLGSNISLTLVGAILYDYHYQQTTHNRAGSSITQNLHYISIVTSTGDINPQLSSDNAIASIEEAIADDSSLPIALVQGSGTPVTFTSTAAFTTGSYSVFGDLGQMREEDNLSVYPTQRVHYRSSEHKHRWLDNYHLE